MPMICIMNDDGLKLLINMEVSACFEFLLLIRGRGEGASMGLFQWQMWLGFLSFVFLFVAFVVGVTKILPPKKKFLVHRVSAGIGFIFLIGHFLLAIRMFF